MKKIKIKDSYILKCIILAVTFVTLCFGLIGSFITGKWDMYIPVSLVLNCGAIIPSVVVLIIRYKTYYYFTPEEIIKMKNGKIIGKISVNQIWKLSYINPLYALLLQWGCGSINIYYKLEDDNQPYSISYSKDNTVLSVSMSKKKALEISKMMGKHISK